MKMKLAVFGSVFALAFQKTHCRLHGGKGSACIGNNEDSHESNKGHDIWDCYEASRSQSKLLTEEGTGFWGRELGSSSSRRALNVEHHDNPLTPKRRLEVDEAGSFWDRKLSSSSSRRELRIDDTRASNDIHGFDASRLEVTRVRLSAPRSRNFKKQNDKRGEREFSGNRSKRFLRVYEDSRFWKRELGSSGSRRRLNHWESEDEMLDGDSNARRRLNVEDHGFWKRELGPSAARTLNLLEPNDKMPSSSFRNRRRSDADEFGFWGRELGSSYSRRALNVIEQGDENSSSELGAKQRLNVNDKGFWKRELESPASSRTLKQQESQIQSWNHG